MLQPSRSSEGYRLLSMGELEEADAEFRSALEYNPEDVKCLLGLTKTLMALGRDDEALEVAEKVLVARPQSLEGHSLRGFLRAKKGDAEGVTELEAAAKDRRASADEHINLGLYLFDQDPDRAQRELEAALRIDPRNARAHLTLGKLGERKGDPRYALLHYQKAADLALPSDFEPWVNKARIHQALGDGEHGATAMLEAITRAPYRRKASLYEEGFRFAMEAGSADTALKIALMAAEDRPGDERFKGWVEAAKEAVSSGGGGKAKGTTELWQEGGQDSSRAPAPPQKAAPSKPVSEDAACKEAEQYLVKEPPAAQEATRILEPLLAKWPAHFRANRAMGMALALQQRYEEALVYAQKAATAPDPHVKAEAAALVQACQRKLGR